MSWSTTQPPIGEGVDLPFGNKGKDTESKGSGKGTGKSSSGPDDDHGCGGTGKDKGTEPKGSSEGKAAVSKQWGKAGKPWNEAYGPEPNVADLDQDTRIVVLLAWAAKGSVNDECENLWLGCDPKEQEGENKKKKMKKTSGCVSYPCTDSLSLPLH